MTMGLAVSSVLGQYAGFTGRARRSELWLWVGALLIVNLALTLVGGLLGGFDSLLPTILVSLVALATLLPALAVGVRRLHDTGRSGWWWLIALVPVVGVVVLLVLYCLRGQPGDNAYGEDPSPTEYDEAHHVGLPPHFTGPYHQPPWQGGSESSY